MKVVTSLGECSPSRSSQSKPAMPSTSVVIGLASEHQQPISVSPASRRCLNALGNGRYGVGGVVIGGSSSSFDPDAAACDDLGPALLLTLEERRELGRRHRVD